MRFGFVYKLSAYDPIKMSERVERVRDLAPDQKPLMKDFGVQLKKHRVCEQENESTSPPDNLSRFAPPEELPRFGRGRKADDLCRPRGDVFSCTVLQVVVVSAFVFSLLAVSLSAYVQVLQQQNSAEVHILREEVKRLAELCTDRQRSDQRNDDDGKIVADDEGERKGVGIRRKTSLPWVHDRGLSSESGSDDHNVDLEEVRTRLTSLDLGKMAPLLTTARYSATVQVSVCCGY